MFILYITEAHASDEWPIGSRYNYKQPQTVQERSEIARDFVRGFGVRLPVFVDDVDNAFETTYAAWPLR